MVRIARATKEEWPTLKRARLAALRNAPYAFGSTYEKERQWDDAKWQEWAEKSGHAAERVVFFAFEGSRLVGLVGGFKGEEDSVDLVSMWVGPLTRRKGVGRALADAVAGWARQLKARHVSLWVADHNTAARDLYLALGYQPTTDKAASAVRPEPPDNPLRPGPPERRLTAANRMAASRC